MIIGIPKEVKNNEYRVGLTPHSVQKLVQRGHSIWVEKNAGREVGFFDEIYQRSGAEIAVNAEEVFDKAEMIIKVKEPQLEECKRLKPGQILFTYLHLAPNPSVTELLMASGCFAIAYETVTDETGGLPLLKPMSEVAGKLSIQAGAHCLEKEQGGRGILLGGVEGVEAAKVLILGAGVVGTRALEIAYGMGAEINLLNRSSGPLRELESLYGGRINTATLSPENIEEQLIEADLVVGAILVPGARAPKIVNRDLVSKMKRGAVIVDVSIDQGGCFETSRPTSYSNPTYFEEGVLHYCVTNMPGAVPITSTIALNNATLPFVLSLADLGIQKACLENPHLLQGLNVAAGKITHPRVAEALGLEYTPAEQVLEHM